ncbi:uncharacterized protein [Hetaerina americana]|uniref:uncharacterized protein isoform X1 n=1 Tax=Hetaerina americana TaxID=62018 RepID=UPI003A7F4018
MYPHRRRCAFNGHRLNLPLSQRVVLDYEISRDLNCCNVYPAALVDREKIVVLCVCVRGEETERVVRMSTCTKNRREWFSGTAKDVSYYAVSSAGISHRGTLNGIREAQLKAFTSTAERMYLIQLMYRGAVWDG